MDDNIDALLALPLVLVLILIHAIVVLLSILSLPHPVCASSSGHHGLLPVIVVCTSLSLGLGWCIYYNYMMVVTKWGQRAWGELQPSLFAFK